MKRGPLLFLLLFGLLAAPPARAVLTAIPTSAPLLKGELRWLNGESLPGEMIEASGAAVTWKSPLFEEPLVIGWHAVRRIDQTLPPIANADAFSIVLRDGSHLFGELVGISPETVSIHSDRHGDVALKRSAVASLRRLQGERLLFAGPVGDVDWRVIENAAATAGTAPNPANPPRPGILPMLPFGGNAVPANPAATPAPPTVPQLRVGPGGALLFPYWNRTAALDLTLPDKVDVEFHLHATGRPDFRLSLGRGAEGRIRLETWDDELVLTAGEQFFSIRKLAEGEHDVALRVCWDAERRKCFVYTPGGELLAEWQAPEDAGAGGPALSLQNKGRDLSLDFLRVREWSGSPPSEYDPKQPRVELSDGRILQGDIAAASSETLSLRPPGRLGETDLAVSQIDAVVFTSAPLEPGAPPAMLTFADGTMLRGEISGVKGGRASLRVSFAAEPLSTRLQDLRQLLLQVPAKADAPAEPPLTALDQIQLDQTTLHGRLTGGSDGRPAWLVVGSTLPATPARGVMSEIVRGSAAAAPPVPGQALFYTSGGDVLPGRLRSLDRTGVGRDATIVEHTKLPADQLDAIQFNPGVHQEVPGFSDPSWRVLKGTAETVHRVGDTLTLDPGTAVGHPWAMQSDELNFNLIYHNFSALRLRLFCTGTEGAGAASLLIVHMGDRISAGLEMAEGRFESEYQHKVAPGPVAIRLLLQEKQIVLSLNGAEVQKFPLDPARRVGAGLILEPTSVWGNGATAVSLSAFSAPASPGRPWLPEVNAEAKAQALTVPRFRQDDPPRQALLAANGDLLRGEIEAATSTDFQFRSGLETLRVPIDRVRAAIWLKKPSAEITKPAESTETQKLLDQRVSRRSRYNNAPLRILIGALQTEAPKLRFQLPPGRLDKQVQMTFNNQTIGEALDQICSLFEMRYRIGESGFILIEPAARGAGGMVQRMYWLKEGAFATGAAAQEALSAKGVEFPAGASAAWQPRARQLTVVNTAANHERLARVLESDFGGLGSPSHWLQLTSGGRLGLVIDKFEGDALLGHHPVYGRCTIPLAQIYTLRTAMPLPTAAMKSLADWRLIVAPEPVIPGAGGESSPDMGKDAKTFQLALLDGGKFNLEQQRGKVTVLDFWATWCGPCVKSLPGLMAAVAKFPEDRVQIVGVNQGEPAEQVKRFIEARGWSLTVALDSDQKVGRLYGVEGIPHTVIVGPDGKVAWVKTGYSPEGEKEVREAIQKLLGP